VIVLPSVDIEGGRAVKRERGARGSGFTDLGDPLAVARRWEEAGAKGVHVVDLDGAEGRGGNRELVVRLVRAAHVPVQVGGGVREERDLKELLTAGARRVLLSTRAWGDPAWLEQVAARFGPKVGLSFDVRDGRLSLRGWSTPGPTVEAGLAIAASAGVGFLLCTDIEREGRGQGMSLDVLRQVRQRFTGDLFAAGGIASREELKALASLGVDGVVVGRALYDGTLPTSVLQEEVR
jgi:phosphoribosylformimino-5-aminoimidazole carboxamide ribotide isomerase